MQSKKLAKALPKMISPNCELLLDFMILFLLSPSLRLMHTTVGTFYGVILTEQGIICENVSTL